MDLNDGYKNIEGSYWKMKKAFGWPTNTVVYVRGTIKKGWKTAVSFNVTELQRIQ
jgi:hypothetical protein